MSNLRAKGKLERWPWHGDVEEYEKRNHEELEKREKHKRELEKDKKDHEFRGTVSIIIEACAESRGRSNITNYFLLNLNI